MNQPPTGVKIALQIRATTPGESRRLVTSSCFAVILFGCWGCAAYLAIVETKPAHLPESVAHEAPLDLAMKYLAAAEDEPPLKSSRDYELLILPSRNCCNSVAMLVQPISKFFRA
jgi:hypothetical protein